MSALYEWQKIAVVKAAKEGLSGEKIAEISDLSKFSRNQAETFNAGASFEDAKEIKNVYQRSAFVETKLPINLALKFADHPDQIMALFRLKQKFGPIDNILKNNTPLIESIIEKCIDRKDCEYFIHTQNFIGLASSLDDLATKMGVLIDQEL